MRTPTIPRDVPMLPIVILDANRQNPLEMEIPAKDRGFRIQIGKDHYDHCSTRDDGAWEYEPLKK